MPRVVVSVRTEDEPDGPDLELSTTLPAAELKTLLASALGWPVHRLQRQRLRVEPTGHVLDEGETLADAGVWDGAWLVLVGDRPAALPPAPLVAESEPEPEPEPVSAPPAPRSHRSALIGAAALLVVLIGTAFWASLSPRTTPAPRQTELPATVAHTLVPTAVVALANPATAVPTVSPTVSPTARPTAAEPEVELRWRAVLAQLGPLWGADWSASIALLDAFREPFPDYAPARDKLYAALVEDGHALADSGQYDDAFDAFDRAIQLLPERDEARAARIALAEQLAPPSVPSQPSAPPRAPAPVVIRSAPAAPTVVPTAVPPAEPALPPGKLGVTRDSYDPPPEGP